MNDLLPLFHTDPLSPPAGEDVIPNITDSQRTVIRGLFSQLGIASAQQQFDLVEELTGRRISAVRQLEVNHAQTLIFQLRNKYENSGRMTTGDSWVDREEDTWIDKL